MKKERRLILIFMFLSLGIMFLGFVLATAPDWIDGASSVNYTTIEDSIYYHNLSANITGYNNDVNFSIDTATDISWTNASGTYSVSQEEVSSWIFIIDINTGNLSINATFDNQTGFFVIPIQATNTTLDGGAIVEDFEFIINATNDAPEFASINTTYNLTQDISFSEYVNATDEEEHYPLYFNLTFIDNCTHADWSGRNPGENCSILNLTSISNTSARMNLTPSRNDAGTYWANLSIIDAGSLFDCPHFYCDNVTYEQNKTTYYSEIILFNVFSTLQINVSNCSDKIFQENILDWCTITIDTKGEEDQINISSYAILRNYAAGQDDLSNTSWFYPNNLSDSSNFTLSVNVSVNASKTEIGNWTINFTVEDLNYGEDNTTQIYVYVNRTTNDVPDLDSLDNVNTSINLQTRINLTVYDDDLLIPDKNESFGGYNETINFTVQILNQSNLSQELSLNGFDVEILNMPVSGTNRTEAKIEFTPNSSESGNYTINITVNDSENSLDYETFDLTILDNGFPYWNEPLQINFAIWENNETYLNLSLNVTDPDGDTLTFSFTNDTAFPSFNLNETTGVINFTAVDGDVGQHLVNITISDGYLTNTTEFNFTIYNINDVPLILDLDATNATPTTIPDDSLVNATEDNYTTFTLWIEDDDLKIPSGQKSFYNESFRVNLTIEGPNSTLFNFTIDTGWWPQPAKVPGFPNRTKYEAIFTPGKVDIGDYNISINVTDFSNSSDTHSFNLTVLVINHAPVLTDLTNQTSAVNRSFYYRINVTDQEDGNSNVTGGNTNFTFSYDFLNGTDFINNNQSIFNLITGELNITFNDTYGGKYHINITVNDSENLNDSADFWLFVYDLPNITLPVSGENFSLQENVTSNLTFQVNHSVGDNLTYLFYIGDILKYNISYYGNNTNLTWQFTPNFTDETYGQFENLTFLVYPTTADLENKNNLNATLNWSVNITHANSPVDFSGYIGDKQTDYNQDTTINLTEYFSDIDYSDTYYNQTVNFNVSSNSSPSYISSSISDWVLTLSSSTAVIELLNITGNDSASTVFSNNFEVEFTTPVITPIQVPSGGGRREVPVSLKIIMPDPVSAYQKDRIVIPIILYNNGKQTLSGIDLTGTVVKDNLVRDDIKVSFDKSSFSSLVAGQKENVTLTIDVDTTQIGTFEITINANVTNPKYHDWGKLYLTIKEGEGLFGRLMFVEEFIAENPECVELTEIVNEARGYFERGDFINTVLKINQAIDACKRSISQPGRARIREKLENELYYYLFIAILVSFFVGILYYFYRRIKLKRTSSENLKPGSSIFNKIFLVISIGLIGLFLLDVKITGFVVNNVFSINQNKFILNFIFIIGILGFLIFLNKKKMSKFVEIATNKICKKYSKDRIKGLFKKKVYTDSGDYIGKVEDVVLGKNKINLLKIKLDTKVKKKNKIKVKGIIIKYKQVKNVGHILIVKGEVLKLNKRNL